MNARIANGGWTEVKNMETLSNLEFEPQGPRHIPVPHDYAITFFKDQLSNHGIEIVAEKIVLSPDTMKCIYVADVLPNGEVDKDFVFSVGFINNNDRTKAFTGLAGTHVYANNATMYISDNSFKTRHTTTVKDMLYDRTANIINWFNDYYKQQRGIIEMMKNTPVTDEMIGKLIMNYIREKYVMSSTNIKRIVDEWDKPKHAEFKERNLWSLQNTCAEVFKKIKSPMFKLLAMDVFNHTFNLIPESKED